MKAPDEQDPTWQLLLKSKKQTPSSAFVRDVVREARKLDTPQAGSGLSAFFSWLKRPLVATPIALGAAALLITALTILPSTDTAGPSKPSPTVTLASTEPTPPSSQIIETSTASELSIAEDIEKIDSLGELVSLTDPASMDDDALANLFF